MSILNIIGCAWIICGISISFIVSGAESNPLPVVATIITGLGVFSATKGLSHHIEASEHTTSTEYYQEYNDSAAEDSVVVIKIIKANNNYGKIQRRN